MIGKDYFEKLAENANPVFVKELRQNFRNRRILIFMSLMLLALYGCTINFTRDEYKENDFVGIIFFLSILLAGFFLSVFICIFGSERRFTEERADKELNYMLMTSLSPVSIIIGKLESSLVMVPFIYSLLLPFMAAAYFMRGIPLESLLLVPFLLPILFLASLIGILAGSFGKRALGVLCLVGLFILAPTLFTPVIIFGIRILGAGFDVGEFLILLACEYVLSILVGGVIILLVVRIISPPKSNCAFALKIYLFALPFITLVLMLPFVFFSSSFTKELFFKLEFLSMASVFCLLLLLSLWEPPAAGIRAYMKCPTGPAGRMLHFIFSTGVSGSLILAAIILFIPLVILPFMDSSIIIPTSVYGVMSFMFSILSIIILSHALSLWMKSVVPAWILALGLAVPEICLLVRADRFVTEIAQIVFMQICPIYALQKAFSVPVMYGRSTVQFFGMLTSCAVTGVLFLAFSPFIYKAFKLHRHPSDDDAIMTPTREMRNK